MNTLNPSDHSVMLQCIENSTHPLCIWLDSNFIVKSWTGDYAYYGYDVIEAGKDCRDSLLFLVGLNAENTINLRFIQTPNNRAVHIDIVVVADQITLVFLDATEQSVNHSVLQQKSNELALMQIEQLKLIENLKRLEKEVEAKRRQAQRANRLKSQFIATMSHEFRTPLTSILGYTMRLKTISNTSQMHMKYLGSVERGAKHLLSLVENLLDHSQIEVGSLSINPIATDVRIVLDKLFSIFEPLAEDKSISFAIDVKSDLPDFLCLDEMRFRQIMVNLISNAINYTNEGSVLVETTWEGDQLTVNVEDTGKGIADRDQQRIFTAFEQLGNEPGTGLGLSIVKHLVTAMGGDLLLTSAIGKGSRFIIHLPAKKVRPDSDACTSEQNKNCKRNTKLFLQTVLIVEDNPDIMRLLESVFDDVECRSLTATTGNDALNLALSEWPDLILLDLNLPDMTGFDVIKSLRSNQFLNPVFIQSAWTSTEYKARAKLAGCDEYLLKPLDITHLTTLLSEYFHSSHDLGMPVERYQKIYQRFLNSLPEKRETLLRLEANNNNRNWSRITRQELHAYAHRLAGSAEMYGMYAIARISKQLDLLLLDYESSDSQDGGVELQQRIIRTISKLSTQFDQAILE
ncbi:MAG TPA: response regulator [Crenotrichaceae bacterium]|nr:response regulator [Crenotrichaceae bacterium]